MWGDITCWTTFSVGVLLAGLRLVWGDITCWTTFSVGDITCWTTFSVGGYYLLDYV